MRCLWVILLLAISIPLFGQKDPKAKMPRSQFDLAMHKAIKADPASFMVNEFRFMFEERLFRRNFYFLSPYAGHWYSPKRLQRQSFFGMRAGLIKYFFTDDSPAGWFLRLGTNLRMRKLVYLDSGFEPQIKHWQPAAGGIASFGRQWIFSPWKSFIWGFSGGVEYLFNFRMDGYRASVAKNYYVMSFGGFLDEFRIFLSLEIGITLRQRNRHW